MTDKLAYWLWQHSDLWCRSRWLYVTIYWRLLPAALREADRRGELEE